MVPPLMKGLLGLAILVAAGCMPGRLMQARITGQLLAHPALPEPALTPIMRGYLQRAEYGDAVAMRMMAFCYQDGVDTPSNSYEAARWQFRAAQAGHPGFGAQGMPQLAQCRP